jgi:hypothetical protein
MGSQKTIDLDTDEYGKKVNVDSVKKGNFFLEDLTQAIYAGDQAAIGDIISKENKIRDTAIGKIDAELSKAGSPPSSSHDTMWDSMEKGYQFGSTWGSPGGVVSKLFGASDTVSSAIGTFADGFLYGITGAVYNGIANVLGLGSKTKVVGQEGYNETLKYNQDNRNELVAQKNYVQNNYFKILENYQMGQYYGNFQRSNGEDGANARDRSTSYRSSDDDE